MARVTVKDRGYTKLLKTIRDGAKVRDVTVGVHADEGSQVHEGELTNIDVASFNEFGTSTIPERSFIRAWHDESIDENVDVLRKLARGVVKGRIGSTTQALDQFGAKSAGDVKKRIIAHIEPPNAQSTIDRKGSSTPLIGKTTQLLNSITWKVNK